MFTLIFENLPKVIIVLAWNFFEDIKRNNQELIDKGVLFISIKDIQNEYVKINQLDGESLLNS